MKKTLILFILFTMAVSGLAQVKNLDSRVTSATVFSNRAMVQREAQINLTAGRAQLCFSNLTPDFLDESVRISGQGTAEVKILDVKVETEYTAEIQQQEAKKLQQKLDSLQWQGQAFNDQLSVLRTKKEFLESLKAEAPKESNRAILTGKLSIQEWQTMLAFLDDNLGDIYKEQRGIGIKQTRLENEIQAVKGKISETNKSTKGKYKNIFVTVETQSAGQLTLAASYITEKANWNPAYDARFSPEDKSLQLTYYGVVRQNTGEDWNNINLVLSTASPVTLKEIPILNVWLIDIVSPVIVDRTSSIAVSSEKVVKDENIKKKEEPEVHYPSASVHYNQLAAVFEIPARNDIPSDNVSHKVTIAILPLAVQYEYATVPKKLDKALLTGKIINTTDYSILEGSVNVFMANDFINKSSIKSTVPTDTFRLALGIDEAIKVERNLINRFTESKGLMGGKTKVTSEYEIVITNNKRTEETITVQDHFPKSRNERIKVQLLVPDEKDILFDVYNRIKWTVKIKPGSKVVLPLKFQVEYPTGEYLVDYE